MEATQLIDDSVLEESEEEDDGEKRGEPLAKLRVLKNKHITETELPLYQGENVLGRNPDSCSLPLLACSVSKQHTIISISVFRGNRRHGNVAAMETEALVWDLGSMNGTRKGRTKLTPHVRYALTEGECVVIADIPCQYVSVDQRGGQGHMQNPTNAHSGRRTRPDSKAQLRGSPSGQGLGRETGTPKTERPTEGKGVNGEMGAPLSTELGGKGKTPAKPLSFEQTPTQPERTLVPESESDSDGEREGRRDKWGKYFVSDSDSHMSSPTCSTFLSPTNKIIPESEDESPITPSSSAKNRPKKIVSFSEEESDMDGPRQQPRRRRAQVIVDDSEEEEEEGKEGKEALGEKETGKRTRGKEDVSVVNQVSQAERDGPMVSTEDKFNMNSDTDVEGEEEMGLSAPVNAVKPPAVTEPPTTDSDPGQIHLDSDTDVDADDDDDDDVVSDSATNVTSFVSDPAEKPDDSAPAVPPVEFHLDTDTDVEEEDTDTRSKTVPESDCSGIRTGIAGHQEILLDSDTDEEDKPFAPPASSRTAELLIPPTSVGPAAAAPLEIRSDSDTDLEEEATQTRNLPPPNVATVTEDAVLASRQAVLPSPTTTTTGAVAKTTALRSQDSDADTDAEDERLEPKPPRCRPPAGMVPEPDLSEPSDLRMDSDTEEDGPGEAGQGQTGGRIREGAAGPGLLPLGGSPGPHQKCSTPLASSVQEEIETQASFSPSDPFRHPALPPVLRPTAALSCSASDSQEDDDFVVAETQSYVLEAQNQDHQSNFPLEPTLDATQPYSLEPSLGEDREEQPSRGSFQLGLSDSSHLQTRDQASESTQAFSFPGGDSDLEATQTYGSGGGSEEPGLGQRSAVFGRNRQVNFVLEATQAYAAQPRSDTEEVDEEEKQPLEFPTPSNVATTETLPMSAYEEEDSEEEEDLVGAKPLTPVRGRSGGAREREEEEHETQSGEVLTNQYLSTAQTLDMLQESDDEEEAKPDSPRRRRPQKQTVDEEETQTVGSYLSTAETQPMFTAAEDDDGDEEEELNPPSPRRRGSSRRGRVEEEETQPSEFLTSSHISTAETQPMGTCDTEEEKEEDTKAKGRAQRRRGKESEAGTSGVSSRGRRGARGGDEESSEPLKTQMKGKAVNTARGGGRRGKVLPEEEERIEKERGEQAEKKQLQKEKVESGRVMKEQQERERMEQELKEQDERLERERVEREETERMEREKRKQEERERLERERKEREEQEGLECERAKREKERLEKEKERIERERKEREDRKRLEREEKEKQEKLERESREREVLERLERERVEKERIEGEQAEKERLAKERKEILEKEKMEREEKKKQERERLKKNKEEKERLDRQMKERNLKEKLEREKKEREKREAEEKEKEIKERQAKEQGEKQAKKDDENEPKTSTRGRRATSRRTVTVPPTTEPQPELDILSSQPEPVPASITRSRSNSSNSVSSERSSIGTQGSRGRGGRKTTSTTEPAPGPDNPTRNSTRRRTLVGTVVAPPAAVEVTVQDILSSEQFVARRTRSRSSSTNSHSSTNSEVSTCIVASVSSQSKGRGGGRRRKTGTESLSPSNRQSEQPPAPKPTARGRRSQKVEDYGPHPEMNEKADSQEAGGTTRGQKKTAKTNEPDPVVADEETTPAQVTEDSPAPRGNGRGRGRGGQKDNTPESTTTTVGGDTPSEEGMESKTGGRGKGRKRGLEEEEESSGFKVPRGKAKVQRGGRCRAAEEEGEKEENPASTPAKRGRASTAQVKKIAEEEKSMEGQSEKMEEAGTVQRKVQGRQSTVQIKKKEDAVLDSNSVTPTGKGRGKRRAPVESSPLAKTPRSSSASPLSSLSSPGTLGPARAATQSYKVLFTGVVDEEGGKVVSHLGGSLAKGVADMTHLVTDRVRRTVKFLCAVARGVPVITTDWLDKCGKVGRFLPTDRYLVKDREQENKFSFCLEESLRTASTQPLLQGYEVHVTRSVLPEPAQMKDIIVCSGARFLSTMPSTQKAQTLVISCGEDWSLCAPALSASLPVLSAEFLLTGILQQRVDLVTHVLSAPKPRAQPGAKGQARGRKRM
ncbi:mediator of DNA damage checkpoint protein 1 isoform X2 [Salmo trutta]|uniref:mediator of DNA damage checkpoint protein 1 isoform X2 n=1 Tax=Salmo trutta TaxID=8032 RepID=UPI001131816A|nr:mediator of DNA damage checkpoint protein 1-like isoform X2 [Salmo trutta]